MIFHVLTIFPELFGGFIDHGVVGRAVKRGLLSVNLHNLRDWTSDRHKTVDDRPFGGGEGMLLKPEPVFAAVESILPQRGPDTTVILLSAQGRLFDQSAAHDLSKKREILLICGRYEGVDERVAQHLADVELSIGDYVITGGELGAAVVMDAVGRLVPGVVGNADSTVWESFRKDEETGDLLLDCPQFTRPADFRGLSVPEVLLGGNHEQIRRWRLKASREKTARNRPDLVK